MQVFELCASGLGQKAIAKRLNAEGAQGPTGPARAARRPGAPPRCARCSFASATAGSWSGIGRASGTGGASADGRHRAEADWVRVAAPALEIVDERPLGGRPSSTRMRRGSWYLKGTKGRPFGRPPVGSLVEVSPDQPGAVWRLRELHEGAHPESPSCSGPSFTAARGITTGGGRSAPMGPMSPWRTRT